MFENLKIAERLKKSYATVTIMMGAAAMVGVITMIVLSILYANALVDYGFAQGDIGRAMECIADARAATRGAIGYDDEQVVQKMLALRDQREADFGSYMQKMEKALATNEEKELFEKIAQCGNAYGEVDKRVLALIKESKREEAQALAISELPSAYADVYDALEALMKMKVEKGNFLSTILSVLSTVLSVCIVIVIIAVTAYAFKLGKKIAKGITEPMGELIKRFGTFAKGDLSSPFPEVTTKDEIADMINESREMAETLNIIISDAGMLMDEMAAGNFAVKSNALDKYVGDFKNLLEAMRMMRDQMISTLKSIEDASEQVSSGAENLSQASQSLAEGASTQAGSVEEIQATMSSITENIKSFANSTKESYEHARKYADEASKSRADMKAMVDTMSRINETSHKIENIISEIEDIASQTNLLSLNASIEAARAGEAGRGFSVVADQIRQLAEQSTRSAVDTRELIEGSLQEIVEGNKAASHMAESIENVVDGIHQIAEAAKNASAMAAEQASAVVQAEQGVNQVSEVVQSTSATAQECSATSEELTGQAVALAGLLSQFTLP